MDAVINVKRACEKALVALDPSVPTAFEGVNFQNPETGLYQKVQFVVYPPEDPVYGKGYYRERIQFQVFIVENSGGGTTNALVKASQIRTAFAKGTTIVESSMPMHVLTTPHIAGTQIADGKIIIPILIDVVAEVYE